MGIHDKYNTLTRSTIAILLKYALVRLCFLLENLRINKLEQVIIVTAAILYPLQCSSSKYS